jgi:predicted amidophosphoribosyltransferase
VAVSHVPLAPVKRRERGFDQCELLAAELARMLGVPHVRLLVRVRNGVVQAESGRAERLAMRSDTFAPAEGADPGPGRLLLIDDVVTTGATMAAAAHAIMRTGLWRTECLAVAGTPPNERHTGAESG